ncbi:MAG TPA: branched-chain amino acid ABC transporter permease [Ramlibacter sp.]|nr:branched-chain amino acid ABC transporter permease [Ramlibacter sp.]
MAAGAPAPDPFLRRRPWAAWAGFALVLLAAPLLFRSSLGIAVLSQIGIAIVACLSFNMLLGQGGMLSFGHAVYTGFGTYAAIHALDAVGRGWLVLPVSLLPLVGGLGGLASAVLLGYLSTRKAGTAFAMITLGVGELVFALALMFPGFFGGEAGVSGNRVVGAPVLGISFGPSLQLYYLIAAYTFACVAAMYAFTRTPLGRILNAVRDNPQRVEFIGYDPRRVRYLAFVLAGFFAGIAGGLAALHFEIATPEVLGPHRSASYLLFTFLGGATVFVGPILGAVLMVLALTLLSEFTRAWLLYLGLLFILMVLYAPGGIASLVLANLRVARAARAGDAWVGSLALAGLALVMLLGAAAAVEMAYQLHVHAVLGPRLRFLGATLDAGSIDSWFGALFVLLTGLGLFELARRHWRRQWQDVAGSEGAS